MTSFSQVVPNYLETPINDEGDMQFFGILRVLRRRILLIATIAIIGTVGAALIGWWLPPRYTAKTLVAMDSPELKVHDFPEAIERLPNQVSTVEMHIKLLASISHLKDVVADLELFSDPEFQPSRGLPATIEHLVTSALAAVGFSSDDTQGDVEGDLLDLIHDKFRIEQEGRSNLIAINFTSLSPDKAALIANRSAELYIMDRLNYNRAIAAKAASSFGERLSTLKAEAERSDMEVEQYRSAHNIAGERQTDLSDRAVSDINKELSDAEAELIGLQARIAFIRDARDRGLSLDTIPEVVASPLMVEFLKQESTLLREEAELSLSLGEKHPRMQFLIAERKKLQERIKSETDRIISNIESRAKIAETRVKSLRASLAKARQESGMVQAAQGPLSQMKRDAAATLQVYGHFLERYKQLKEQESLVQPDVQIVSYATPPDDPSSPSWFMFALAGFATSTILGAMLAVAVERVDRGIRSASDVYNVLGLIRIGLVPRLHGLGSHKPHQYLLKKPFSAYAEAMRSILAALRLSAVSPQPKVLLVTSSVPDEGKTTLSISLAVSAEVTGQRVILVDMDFRRPSIARDLGIEPQSGGVVDYLTQDRSLDEFIQRVDNMNFDCLPAQSCGVDPMLLVGSKKMADLLDELRARYDLVVIDSPPVLGITEARILAPLADAVIFVVKWGSTRWEVARNALSLLPRDNDRSHIAGVVLTQMDQRKHMRYGFGDTGDYYQKYHEYFPK